VGRRGLVDEGEADPTAGLEEDQRVVVLLVEPARQVIRPPEALLVERVVAVVEFGEIVQVERIDVGQPLPVGRRAAGVAQLDVHRPGARAGTGP